MTNEKVLISQKDNYAGNFGLVFRSSAIFYALNNNRTKTTISFLNYWILKRDLKVNVVINIRELDGTLLSREIVDFSDGMVFNYTPPNENFEGSIEVEVFSLENMVIPYAAIMAIYETNESVSMVHSYARIYSPHEIEENRTISTGHESCWSVRDSDAIRSFCVMHNGPKVQKEQNSKVTITNHKNERYSYEITIPELKAYASHRINLNEEITDIKEKLDGQAGNASISFELNDSFTRLLVGNEKINNGELQVTHSNFNYLEHLTDSCGEDNNAAYMHLVNLPEKNLNVIVYPDMQQGQYVVSDGDATRQINSKERISYTPTSRKQIFSSTSNVLPTRIVTAISGSNEGKLPFECSLGVIHNQRPAKRMYWGVAAADAGLTGRLFITVLDDIYGTIKDDSKIIIRLYSSSSLEYVEKTFSGSEANRFESGALMADIFDDCENFLSGELGYYTVFSEYGGLFVYSSLENESGSFTIEHGF